MGAKSPPPVATRWQKNKSGNPSGKPKDIHGLRALARSHAPDAVATLVKIMSGRYPAAARVQAAGMLLDRGFGKPQQHVDADLRIDAVRITAAADFDARIIATVSKLGRDDDGTPHAGETILELPLAERLPEELEAADDEARAGTFRRLIRGLKSGPANSAQHDRLDGYRDNSTDSSIEPQ